MTRPPQSLKEELISIYIARSTDMINQTEYLEAILSAIELRLPERKPTLRKMSDATPATKEDIKRDGYNQALRDIRQLLK